MATFFISDVHLYHKNISRFCPETRPHSNVDQMNNEIVNQWVRQVTEQDTVWILGDMFFCNAADAIRMVKRLPGHKNLVYGNHDKAIRNNSELRGHFESVREYAEIKVDGHQFMLFHYPIWEWNNMHRGAIHLHGHIHNRVSGVPGRIINVCMDSPEFDHYAPYRLYSSEEVIRVALRREVRQHHPKTEE